MRKKFLVLLFLVVVFSVFTVACRPAERPIPEERPAPGEEIQETQQQEPLQVNPRQQDSQEQEPVPGGGG